MIVLRPHQKRALQSMLYADKGQVIVPTGGGKTMIMIQHAKRIINENNFSTIVVVEPRILLAQQLCEEFLSVIKTYSGVLHVHSGDTKHQQTTNPTEIYDFAVNNWKSPKLIFATYHSLGRILSANINIDCCYFDEAHNSTKRNFFPSVAAMSDVAVQSYYFTATPVLSSGNNRGMNNGLVYGNVLENVQAKELINNGSIVEPTIVPFETDLHYVKEKQHIHHSITIQDILNNLPKDKSGKVLVSVPSSKVLSKILGHTTILNELRSRGYDVLHITSKFVAYVNDKKVKRDKFFTTLRDYGSDINRKFIVFHYSILSEGISVPGLTHCILLRTLNLVEMAQTVGRVIRMDKRDRQSINEGRIKAGEMKFYAKPTGYVTVPIHKEYGTRTINRLQKVVDNIFIDGIPPRVVRR